MNVQEYLAKKHNAPQNAQKPPEAAVRQHGVHTTPQRTNAAEGLQQPQNSPFLTGGTPWESYRAMYRAVFNFHEKHSGPKETQADWEQISAEAEAIAAQYGGGDFITDLLSCVYCELDRQHSKAE